MAVIKSNHSFSTTIYHQPQLCFWTCSSVYFLIPTSVILRKQFPTKMRDGDNNDSNSLEFSFGHLCNKLPDAVLPMVSGCVAFGSTLAASTAMQKAVGVSTGTSVVPSLLGFATVCAASLASEQAAILTHQMQQDPRKRNFGYLRRRLRRSIRDVSGNIIHSSSNFIEGDRKPLKLPMHEVRVCLIGLLAFKSLGGRFWAISPSSYTHLGSFARWSIPCTENYANAKQRVMIEKMGRKWGCHTCGSHMYFSSATTASGKTYSFVGDHMPPKSVAKHMNDMWLRKVGLLPKVKFRFYPQCVTCSNAQGSILSKAGSNGSGLSSSSMAESMKGAGGGQTAHFHGLRPRINHLVGGVLAAATVVGASDAEINNGNQRRLELWQTRIEKRIRNTIDRFKK